MNHRKLFSFKQNKHCDCNMTILKRIRATRREENWRFFLVSISRIELMSKDKILGIKSQFCIQCQSAVSENVEDKRETLWETSVLCTFNWGNGFIHDPPSLLAKFHFSCIYFIHKISQDFNLKLEMKT